MGALAALAGAAGSKGLAKKGRQDIADEVALLLGARQLEPAVQLALPTPAVESESDADADEEDDDEDDDDEVDDGDDQSLGE